MARHPKNHALRAKFTLLTQADAYCSKCGKTTPHRLYDGQVKHCLTCFKKLKNDKAEVSNEKSEKPEQGRLFE
jgi:predicted amidophosphoribosyltransferase